MMHKVDTERVELDTYQLKNFASTWFDLWTLGGDQDSPYPSWACFEEAFFGRFVP